MCQRGTTRLTDCLPLFLRSAQARPSGHHDEAQEHQRCPTTTERYVYLTERLIVMKVELVEWTISYDEKDQESGHTLGHASPDLHQARKALDQEIKPDVAAADGGGGGPSRQPRQTAGVQPLPSRARTSTPYTGSSPGGVPTTSRTNRRKPASKSTRRPRGRSPGVLDTLQENVLAEFLHILLGRGVRHKVPVRRGFPRSACQPPSFRKGLLTIELSLPHRRFLQGLVEHLLVGVPASTPGTS